MKNRFVSGVTKSPSDKRDLLVTSVLKYLTLPEEVSYRKKMTPIRNQGREGSCTGHAACYLKEYQEKIDYNRFVPLSPRFIYEEAKRISGDKEGSTMKAVSQALIGTGICEDSFWPYIANDPGTPKDGAYENAIKFKVNAKYTRITNEKELRGALAEIGPILAGVVVYKNWYRDKEGHIPNPSFWEKFQGPLGGHAITITGYSDKTKEYEFINSWGEWGDQGFGYITYAHMKSIIMDSYALVDIQDPLPYKTTNDLGFWEKRGMWI